MSNGAKVLMISNREGNRGGNQGGNRGARNEMENAYPRYEGGSGGRNEMGYEMRREGGSGGRNDYGEMNYPRYEYGGMNYGESRFRDRRGREHYDNGRFSPMRGEMDDMEDNYGGETRRGSSMEMRYGNMRGEEMRGAYDEMRGEERRRGGSGGRSYYPFGPVPPVYEREPNMNRIGFSMDGNREFGQDYTTNAAYSHMDETAYRTSNPMMGGAKGGEMKLTEEMADEWMKGLHNEDGTKGPHWTKEQTKQVMNQKGIKMDSLEFYTIMNALYADYCSVLKKHGVNTIDFYVDMACAWLNDKDAQEGKTARYFQYITK